MEGRSLAASSKRFVRASSTMKTVGSLASIALDIAIILCIVGLCNLIGSNPCPTSSHRSLAVKNGVDWEKLVGTLRAHTHKTTQNTPPSHPQCACGEASPPTGRKRGPRSSGGTLAVGRAGRTAQGKFRVSGVVGRNFDVDFDCHGHPPIR